MSQTEADVRKQQAIARLIQLQAERAVNRALPKTMTTIVDGEIIRVEPSSPPRTPGAFSGQGERVGELEDVSVNPGPGMEPLVRARKIKATIDQALVDAVVQVKQVDPGSPFLQDLDLIGSELAKFIVSDPDQLRGPNYESRQMARINQILGCLATYKEIRQAADGQCQGLAVDAPERLRAATICATAAADLQAAPDNHDPAKQKASEALAKLAGYIKTRAGIEKALDDAAQKIRAVDAKSAFLEDLDALRDELHELIVQGSEKLTAEGFEATQVQRVVVLPAAANAYQAVEGASTAAQEGIESIWLEAPQLTELPELCNQALADMRSAPAEAEAIKKRSLDALKKLETGAKVGLFDDALKWLKEKYPRGRYPNDATRQMAEFLEAERDGAGNQTYNYIQVYFRQYVWGVMKSSGRVADPSTASGSGLPKMTRDDANTKRLAVGRAVVKAAKQVGGVDRINGVNLLITGNITNERTGYEPQFRHWHVAGSGSDNMIYHVDGTLLGFVNGHIDKKNPTAQRDAKNCERQYGKPTIAVAVEGNKLYEITDT